MIRSRHDSGDFGRVFVSGHSPLSALSAIKYFLILASNDTLAPIKAKFQLLSCSVAPGSIKLMFGVVNFQKKLDAA